MDCIQNYFRIFLLLIQIGITFSSDESLNTKQIYTHIISQGKASWINLDNIYQNEMIGATFQFDQYLSNCYYPSIQILDKQELKDIKLQTFHLSNQLQNSRVTLNNFLLITNNKLLYGLIQNDGTILMKENTEFQIQSICQEIINITQIISFITCFNTVTSKLEIIVINPVMNTETNVKTFSLDIQKINSEILFQESKGQLVETTIYIYFNILTDLEWIRYSISIDEDQPKIQDKKINQKSYKQIISLNEIIILLDQNQIYIFDNSIQLITQRQAQQQECFLKMNVEYQLDGNLTILMLSNKSLQIFDLNLLRQTITLISQQTIFNIEQNIIQLGFNKQFIYLLYENEFRIHYNNKKLDLITIYNLTNAIDCIFQKERNILIIAENLNNSYKLSSFQIGEPKLILTEAFSKQNVQYDNYYVTAQLPNTQKTFKIKFLFKDNDFNNDPIFTFQNLQIKNLNEYKDLYFDYNTLVQGYHQEIDGTISQQQIYTKNHHYGYKKEEHRSSSVAISCTLYNFAHEIYCLQSFDKSKSSISIGYYDLINQQNKDIDIIINHKKNDRNSQLMNCQCIHTYDTYQLDILMEYNNKILVIRTNRNLTNYSIKTIDIEENILSSAILQESLFIISHSYLLKIYSINSGYEMKWELPTEQFISIYTNYLSYPNLLFLINQQKEKILIAQIDQLNQIFEIINDICITNIINKQSQIKLGIIDGGLFISSFYEQNSKYQSIILFFPQYSLFVNKQNIIYFTQDLQDWNFTKSFLQTTSQHYMYGIFQNEKKEQKVFIFKSAQNSYSLRVSSIELNYIPIRISALIFPQRKTINEKLLIQSTKQTYLYQIEKSHFNFQLQEISKYENQFEIDVQFKLTNNDIFKQTIIIKKTNNNLINKTIQIKLINSIQKQFNPIGTIMVKDNFYLLTNECLYELNKNQNIFIPIILIKISCSHLFYDQLFNKIFAICIDQGIIQILIFDIENHSSINEILTTQEKVDKICETFYKNQILQVIFNQKNNNSQMICYILNIIEQQLKAFKIQELRLNSNIEIWRINEFYLQMQNNQLDSNCQIFGFTAVYYNFFGITPFILLCQLCIRNELVTFNSFINYIKFITFSEEESELLEEIIQVGDGVKLKNDNIIVNFIIKFKSESKIYEFQFNKNYEYVNSRSQCNLNKQNIQKPYLFQSLINGNIISSNNDGKNQNYFIYSNPQINDNCQPDTTLPIISQYSLQNNLSQHLTQADQYLLTISQNQIDIIQIENFKEMKDIQNKSQIIINDKYQTPYSTGLTLNLFESKAQQEINDYVLNERQNKNYSNQHSEIVITDNIQYNNSNILEDQSNNQLDQIKNQNQTQNQSDDENKNTLSNQDSHLDDQSVKNFFETRFVLLIIIVLIIITLFFFFYQLLLKWRKLFYTKCLNRFKNDSKYISDPGQLELQNYDDYHITQF